MPKLPVSALVLASCLSTVALSAPPVAAQVQSEAQQACAVGMDKEFAKAVKAAGKEVLGCMKDIAKSQVSAIGCFDADGRGTDRKGKIAKAMAKMESVQADSCSTNLPDFGFTGAGVYNRRAQAADDAATTILFGDEFATALPSGAPDKARDKCQQKVAKALMKCRDTRLKSWTACRAEALAGGADDQAAANACIGADPDGKIAKACSFELDGKVDKLRSAVEKNCQGVDLTAAFPGCDAGDTLSLYQCLSAAESCSTCGLMAETSGDLAGVDCDLLDNGADDTSCLNLMVENVVLPNGVEPAETPGSPGVVVTNPNLLTQFGGPAFSLNNSLYSRHRVAGPEQTPDAIMIFNAGFGGDTNNALMLIQDLIPAMWRDHGILLEVWGYHRRANQLEDREGIALADDAGDEWMALDWYYGDALGLTLHPDLAAGPNRRAVFYDGSDVPFVANWTTQVASRDIDAIVEAARAVVSNDNVFMAGHSAGTGFTARYASTDFDFSGLGPAEPGYAKLRGLILFEGGGGSTLGDPITADSANRIVAKADGGLFGAVRDGAARCVDGTTPCTIATEATDCLGQVPPVCTESVDTFSGFFGPELSAAAELASIQAITDANTGLSIVQQDLAGPDSSAVDLVPELSILGVLSDSTTVALLGQFLDDDEVGALLSPALANSLGKLSTSTATPRTWIPITRTLPANATPDNGPQPTTLPASMWGQEKEVVSMARFQQTFTAGGTNAADWYYESSGYSTTSAPGRCPAGTCTVGNVGASCTVDSDCAQSISLDSSAVSVGLSRPDIVNLVEAGNIDIPVICFGGSNGLTPVGANYLPFAQSIASCAAPSCDGTPRVVDDSNPSEAFPTYGSIEGGYEVYIREGLSHVDVIAGENVPDVDVIAPLGAFIARNVQ